MMFKVFLKSKKGAKTHASDSDSGFIGECMTIVLAVASYSSSRGVRV